MTESCLIYKNFVPEAQWDELREYALSPEREKESELATTSGNALNYRVAEVIKNPRCKEIVEPGVQIAIPEVCQRLNVPLFIPQKVEMELTITRDGGFYKKHQDNGHPKNKNRKLSYVLYMSANFYGGDLAIFLGNTVKKISPYPNVIAFFPCHLEHEVLPMYASHAASRRITINGWVS